MVYILYNKQ